MLGNCWAFENQLFRRSSIGRNNAAQCTDVANVAHQSACINVPNDGNLVTIQIQLRGLRGRQLDEI